MAHWLEKMMGFQKAHLRVCLMVQLRADQMDSGKVYPRVFA